MYSRHFKLNPRKCGSVEVRWTPHHVGLGVSVRALRLQHRGRPIRTFHVFLRFLWVDVTFATSESSYVL